MEEEVSNNGGPWHARMNSRAPRQKEKKKKKKKMALHGMIHHVFKTLLQCILLSNKWFDYQWKLCPL